MRLLFRHIKNSVLRTPYQALILLLTVFFSAIIFAGVCEVQLSVREERILGAQLKNGRAEIVLEPSAESASRYLTVADTGLDEKHVSGYFALPLEVYGETGLAGAADFDTVGNVFDFSFLAYEECTEAEASSAVFVTAGFAEKYGLALGDEVEVTLLGRARVYTVRGINQYDFFGRYALLLQAEGALGVLSSISPVFAAFDEAHLPCNYIYVDYEGEGLEDTMSALNKKLSAFGWRAEICSYGLDEYTWKMANFMIVLLLLLSMVIAWVLVGFSLRILGEKRQEEMNIFWQSGMPQSKIFLAFCVEIFFYLVIGTAAGIAVAILFLELLDSVGLYYAVLRLTWRGVLVAVGAELAVGGMSLFTYKLSLSRVKKPRESKAGRWLAVCLGAVVLCMLGCLALPIKKRVFAAVGVLAFAIGVLLLSAKPFCRWISSLFASRFDRKGRGSPHFVLATKNCANIGEIHNVYRILNILLSIAVILTVGFSYFNWRLDTANEFFRFEYILLNAGESAVAAVEEVEGVDSVCAAFVGESKFESGEKLHLIDVDLSYFDGEGEMPTGDGICLPQTIADLQGLKIGDACSVEMFGGAYTFTVVGYSGKDAFFAYIDADYYGFRKNMVFVKGEKSEQTLAALTESVAVYGAIIEKPESLLASTIRIAESFNRLMGAYLGLVFALSAIGCVNLVWVCYARRRKQFSDLMMVGMTKGEVAKMIVMEGTVILLSVLLVSGVCSGLLCVALDNGMRSFGFRLFV